MLRTVAKKVAWVGRPASMVFGLALVMALASCGGGSQETNAPANSSPNDVIEGRFDVVRRQRGVSTATEGGG